MKAVSSLIAVAALCLTLPFSAAAEEKATDKKAKKERTTRGTLVCAKCSLKKTESCQAALQINRKNKQGKEINRVFLLENNDVAKAFHDNICSGDKVPVAVTGKREGKGKNQTIVASKIVKAKAKKKAKKS